MVAIGEVEAEKDVFPVIQHISGSGIGAEYIDNIEMAKLILIE